MKKVIGKVIGRRTFEGKNNQIFKQVCVTTENDRNTQGTWANIIYVKKDYNVGDKITLIESNFRLYELED